MGTFPFFHSATGNGGEFVASGRSSRPSVNYLIREQLRCWLLVWSTATVCCVIDCLFERLCPCCASWARAGASLARKLGIRLAQPLPRRPGTKLAKPLPPPGWCSPCRVCLRRIGAGNTSETPLGKVKRRHAGKARRKPLDFVALTTTNQYLAMRFP